MPDPTSLSKRLDELVADLAGAKAACVIDVESGMPLAKSSSSDFDCDAAAAHCALLLQGQKKMQAAMNSRGGLREMVMTLTEEILVIKPLTPGVALFVAASSDETNLAMVRFAIGHWAPRLAS